MCQTQMSDANVGISATIAKAAAKFSNRESMGSDSRTGRLRTLKRNNLYHFRASDSVEGGRHYAAGIAGALTARMKAFELRMLKGVRVAGDADR